MERHLIMTVCKGNMHRSVVAEACINKVLKDCGLDADYAVISRGIQGTEDTEDMEAKKGRSLRDYKHSITGITALERNRPSLEALGLDISEHISRQISPEDAEHAALILVMDRMVLDAPEYGSASLVRQFPRHRAKMCLFRELEGVEEGIEDCGPEASEAQYRRVNEYIHRVVRERIETLLNWVARGVAR